MSSILQPISDHIYDGDRYDREVKANKLLEESDKKWQKEYAKICAQFRKDVLAAYGNKL